MMLRRRSLLNGNSNGGGGGNLVLWHNFDPQGQTFINHSSVIKTTYDLRSNCTFFCDFTLDEIPTTTKYLISLGGNDISSADGRGNGYPRSVFHMYYNAQNQKLYLRNSYRASSSQSASTTDAVVNIDLSTTRHFKVALNGNGWACNGTYVQNSDRVNGLLNVVYSTTDPVRVGVECGTPPDDIYYNDIIIYNEFMSEAQMVALTTV